MFEDVERILEMAASCNLSIAYSKYLYCILSHINPPVLTDADCVELSKKTIFTFIEIREAFNYVR